MSESVQSENKHRPPDNCHRQDVANTLPTAYTIPANSDAMKSLGQLFRPAGCFSLTVKLVSQIVAFAIFIGGVSAFAQAPQISQQPQSQTVAAGSNVIFSVIASGTPTPVYQWRFNGTNLLAGATNASFTISNAQPIKAGNYDVVVSNSLGAITSQVAALSVSWQAVLVEAGGAGLPVTTLNTQGGAWLDYDNDGFLDLVIINLFSQNNLYHNNGNGTFSQVTTGSLVTTSGSWAGVGVADYDNDGNVDLLVAGSAANSALYRNNGGGSFTSVTGAVSSATANSHSVAFGDVNRDGFVDVLLPQRPGSHLFFQNVAGTFQSADIGLSSQPGDANSATWGDFNGDGWLDLFSAHQPNADCLYTNSGSGNMARITPGTVDDAAANTVTGAWGDYDNDGDLDLIIAYFSGGDERLFRNDGAGGFVWVDTSVLPRLGEDTYSVAWGDYNNDGFLDLFVANAGGAPQVNHLWLNGGNGTFTNTPPGTLPHAKANSTGAVWADYDRDGNLDLLVTDVNSYNRVFRNSGSGGSWLEVKLNGQKSNRSGIGAILRLGTIVDGTFRWQRRDIGGGGYGCANPLEAHFGLGDATNITALRIEWPSGAVQTISNVAPRQVLTVTEAGIQLARSSLALAAGARGAFEALPGTNQFTYQWYFGSTLLVGETNRVLGFPIAATNQAGDYVLRASYSSGMVELKSHLDVVSGLNSNLAAYYPLDGNAIDVGPSQANGTPSGTQPIYDRLGNANSALSFNGLNEQVLVPDGPTWTLGASDWTIALWVKLNSLPENKVLIDHQRDSAATAEFSLAVLNEATYGAIGVQIAVTATYANFAPFPQIVDGSWHFVVARRSGQQLQVLVDGLARSPASNVQGTLNDSPEAVHFGGRYYNDLWLHGAMDEVRLWKRGLGDAEVMALYFSESPEWLAITQQPAGSTNVAGTNLVLSVAATGVGTLNYQWRFNGANLLGATNTTFTITNVRPVHSGAYTVVVSNSVGSITSQVATLNLYWPTNLVSIGAGALTSSGGNTVAAGSADYNGDGWNDVFLSNTGADPSYLLRNLTNGTFGGTSGDPNVPAAGNLNSPYTPVFADYDNDGRLDLYLTFLQGPDGLTTTNRLYRNLDGTNFLRITNAGLPVTLVANSDSAAWADLDADGWLDLVVAYRNRSQVGVYRNLGDGTFSDFTATANLNISALSVSLGDYDDDGRLDVACLSADYPNSIFKLFRNLGGFSFTNLTNTTITPAPEAFSVRWQDYNNDGKLDLRVYGFNQLAQIWTNSGTGVFSLSFQTTNCGVATADFNLDGRIDEIPLAGSVAADLNHDGLPDILKAAGGNEQLWTNQWNGAGWLVVKLVGQQSNRSGIGAKVRATATIDGSTITQTRQISGGEGYGSYVPLEAYFGFGDATNLSLLRIEWPSGKVQQFTNVTPNQFLTIQEQTIFSFGVNGSGSVSYSPVKSNYFVGETITLTASTNRYYRFVQWSDGNTNAVRNYTVGLSNVLMAVFTNVVPLESLVLKQWEASFGGTNSDNARAIRATSDGGYILACESASGISGNKFSTNSGGNDIWVIKLDAHGLKQWERTFGGTNSEGAGDIIQTSDGGYLIAGNSYSPPSGNKTATHFGDADGWLIKIDSTGIKQWEMTYGTDGQEFLGKIVHALDGGFIITSGTYSPSLPTGGNRTAPFRGASGYADAWILKVDSAGSILWDVSFGPPGSGEASCSVVAPDGNIWVWGSVAGSQGYLGGMGGVRTSVSPGGLSDNWLLKLTPTGTFLWERSYGSAGGDYPSLHSIQLMADGSGVMDGRFNVGSNEFGYVVRVGPAGNTLYERTYGGTGLDAFKTLALSRDGGVYVGGESDSPAGSGTKTASAYGGLDGWIAKLDSELNKKWDYSLGGSGSNETITHIIATPDGGFAVAGRSDSTPGSGGGNKTSASYGSGDVWVVKMFEAELPLGTPVVLVNDLYSVSNSFAIPETNSIMVALQTSFTNGFLFYTLDGSFPVAYDNATTYAEPGSPGTVFTVTNSCVVTAIAYDENGNNEILGDPVFISVVPVYNLTNTTPGGGTVTMNPPGGIYWSNTVVTLTPVASNGWTFMRWEGSVTNTSNPLNLTMDSSKSIRAVFGTGISNSSNPVGSGTVSLWPATGPYEYGSIVRLTGVPTAPNRFNRWFAGLGGPTNNPLNFTVLVANTNITANFSTLTANNFTLTALLNGYGTVTRSPLANQYLSNTVVSLTAVPDLGYVFTGWSGNVSGLSNPINVTLNSNKVVTASFVIAGLETNQPPSIAITNPASLATFTAPTNITINASTTDSDGSVTQVVFRVGASLIGTVAAAPFNFVWTNAPVGTNSLSAIATDNGGLSTTSAPVSVVVETALPIISLTAPANNASFFTPANVSITASVSDADVSISNVTFYAGATLIGTLPAQPVNQPLYNFTWSNVVVGSYSLSARVQDLFGPSVTSAPVTITVSAPPGTNPPVFRFNPGGYTVNASNGSVVLTVVNDGDLGGLVNYTTLDGTAYGGSGYSGDYTTQLGSLTFTNGQQSKTITIGIRNNFLNAPDVAFQVQLFQPSAGTLGSPAVATVTIQRNDPNGATNSLTTTAVGSGQPATSGTLHVTLNPPEAGGQWRFPWEFGWRTNGATASSLEAENYPVEFRNVSNYVAYPASLTVALTNGGTTPATGEYHPGLESGGVGVGSLTVNISPNSPVGSGWRLFGEASYRSPNSTASNLLADTYFVEFAPVGGWAKPTGRAVIVAAGQGTTIQDNYLLPQSLPPGAGTPGQLLHSQIVNPASFPYWFNGQLQTDAGFGSGVAVRETVVLTAAHMVFNDVTLSYVNRAWWSYQKEAGVFDPKPLAARGWYVLSGYAAQRTNDIPNPPVGTGVSSAASRNLDVAALYFTAPAARGGFGGYLASDVVPNPWLTDGAKNKMLVGYPVDGSSFGQTVQAGRMYATALQTTAFSHATNNTYTTASFIGYPGNSGGPVYVAFNSYYYPAGVYLGTIGSGVNSVSVVRAINSDVVNLINLASSLGDAGTNNTGGGVITLIASSVSEANPAYLQVLLGPPTALQAGAGWRLSGDAAYGSSTNYTRIVTSTNATVEFKPLVGWNPPNISSYAVQAGTLTTIPGANYTQIVPVSPSMLFLPAFGFGISGTTNTKYRIEYRTNLASGTWLPFQTNTITSGGFNLLIPFPPTNGLPAAFYRAVWLP